MVSDSTVSDAQTLKTKLVSDCNWASDSGNALRDSQPLRTNLVSDSSWPSDAGSPVKGLQTQRLVNPLRQSRQRHASE